MPVLNQGARALIVGGSGGIGLGFVKKLLSSPQYSQVFATHRPHLQPHQGREELLQLKEGGGGKLTCLSCDPRVDGEVEEMLKEIRDTSEGLDLVVNCVGMLHDNPSATEKGEIQPEKSVSQLSRPTLLHYFDVNTVPTALLAKHLQTLGLFKHQNPSVFASISGRVGSIGDNKMGGWHGYRASKAALHMIMKGVSIEYKRTNPNTTVVSLHPGTVSTNLSAPFVKFHKAAGVLSPEESATALLDVIQKIELQNSGQVWGWDGDEIEY